MQEKDVWPELRARAEARLKELRDGDKLDFQPQSSRGRALAPYLRASMVLWARIYQEQTGWGVDIILDESRLPAGVANTIGTPVGQGLPTPEAALNSGVAMAVQLLEGDRSSVAPPTDTTEKMLGFKLFGWDIDVPRKLLEDSRPALEKVRSEFGAEMVASFAGHLIASASERLCLDARSRPDLDRPQDLAEAGRLMLGIGLALHARQTCFPFRETSADSEDVDSPETRH